MTDHYECTDQVDLAEALAELRAIEDQELRALYTTWHAGLETPPAWYVAVGRPAPPGPQQGTDYRPGVGWVEPKRKLPKRVSVEPVANRPGFVVSVRRDRAGKSPADRVTRLRKLLSK